MYFVNVKCSLFFRPLFAMLKKPAHIFALWNVPALVLITLTRGRTKITKLLMSYYTNIPRPPVSASDLPEHVRHIFRKPPKRHWLQSLAVGDRGQYHHDSHVPKTLPTLIFASQNYSDKGLEDLEMLLDVPPRSRNICNKSGCLQFFAFIRNIPWPCILRFPRVVPLLQAWYLYPVKKCSEN